jgi:hypothetical protein
MDGSWQELPSILRNAANNGEEAVWRLLDTASEALKLSEVRTRGLVLPCALLWEGELRGGAGRGDDVF